MLLIVYQFSVAFSLLVFIGFLLYRQCLLDPHAVTVNIYKAKN